ncbi:MAG TPA: DUF87 domain-containing protein [Anaerolineae bacterium]|nr:DUF87 domain-containing protein [Anaerolineae bacterium]HQM15267.1 DUF87 domain-containing protein [Anaerolineae bacterium]
MQNINQILRQDALVQLIQPDFFVGWTYSIDYEYAFVMTNDLWKAKALGVPHNCFLVAAAFDPEAFANTPEVDREVILLRVIGSAKLPQDDDMVRTKVDFFQQRTGVFAAEGERDIDDITLNQLQFGGLRCRVLGTFFTSEGELWLGSDLESFATASRLNVYRPHGEALKTIVNYVDPIRRRSAREDAQRLGLPGDIPPFRIGTVRYTSTDRLHRRDARAEIVPVSVQPSDFLARRTAVLGMTRTGKSNMIKQMVSVVKRVADEGQAQVGQIIYDINGEYANPNQQDQGAIADVYPQDTVRYRMMETPGFEELRTNFYEQLNEGFGIIQRELESAGRVTTDYVRAFVNMSLDEPDKQERSEWKRWQVRVAAYKVLLYVAGFTPPSRHLVRFDANAKVQEQVNAKAGEQFPDLKDGLTLEQARGWFLAAREANLEAPLLSSTAGKNWVDDTLQTLLDMIAQKRGASGYISGYRILADSLRYHSPRRTTEVAEEIYRHLVAGKIVILDLSVGDARIREKVSTQIAQRIFQNSMNLFVQGQTPPNIVVYIEEAHNLIGKRMELTETWPRLAKEGAKYRIALVYATQEVSSVHPNILANTENWFITHLNNLREIKELAQFYDFDDFSDSLIRAQDVGFARVKTLSSPFVIPTQIDKFDPDAERRRMTERQHA